RFLSGRQAGIILTGVQRNVLELGELVDSLSVIGAIHVPILLQERRTRKRLPTTFKWLNGKGSDSTAFAPFLA
ncbi:MAG: hypothetical protein IJ521_05505, partial [Schwartzia sp.]|nr:hypothetical protein [Schwartzia sp. (in: firmicutes)]